jgi:hypothetical protein
VKRSGKNKLKLVKLGHTSGNQYGQNPYATNAKRQSAKEHS